MLTTCFSLLFNLKSNKNFKFLIFGGEKTLKKKKKKNEIFLIFKFLAKFIF